MNKHTKNSTKTIDHCKLLKHQAGTNSSNHKVVIAIKRARIAQYLAFYAVRWQEDKYAPQQQQQQFKS